jgi:hypothetical protein
LPHYAREYAPFHRPTHIPSGTACPPLSGYVGVRPLGVCVGSCLYGARMNAISIPTEYNCTRFRSRLEARWAAWFDLVGWRWDYEPTDMHGWCPDFVIYGALGHIFVEVKPEPIAEVFKADGSIWGKAIDERHIYSNHVLLLGLGPVVMPIGLAIGYCNDPDLFDSNCVGLALGQRAHQGTLLGYAHRDSGWYDRVTGYPGDQSPACDQKAAIEAWARAGTAVQWRGK